MWERTLQDLIRGLRANKKDESRFILQAIDEIREEVKTKDMELKAAAVLKLTYLDMLGYDMKWASFYVVEVMSSPKFHLKSIGYLAASQSFEQDTDVLMLTTNLIKKDLSSHPNDVAVALDGLSNIVTPGLAQDLSRDLYTMLNHSRALIRKRAVLVLYKLFLKYPETLDQNFSRLREKLEDPDPGVVSATVNVLCELARTRPQTYLPLAPMLFHLLTTSSNNWMLIKVIKLFGSLTPFEPRLVRKLHGPMTELISTTPAISLLYECVRTCIIGGMLDGQAGQALADTCVRKLAAFLQDPDQNLKYIALLALVKIVPTHPHLISEYQEIILSSIDDVDMSIRIRALELLSAMINRSNIQPIVQYLLSHLMKSQSSASSPPTATEALLRTASGISSSIVPSAASEEWSSAYRLEVSQRIIDMCTRSQYENVDNFEWLLSVMVDLAYIAQVEVGSKIKECLIDVCVREPTTRQYAVKLMAKVLNDDTFLHHAGEPGGCSEVLGAAAWICGEYARCLTNPRLTLRSICHATGASLSSDILLALIDATLKIFGQWAADLTGNWSDEQIPDLNAQVAKLREDIEKCVIHPDIEVQERAANASQLLLFITMDIKNYKPATRHEPHQSEQAIPFEPQFPKSLYLLYPLFSEHKLELLAPDSQRKVSHPANFDLTTWITTSEIPVEEATEPHIANSGEIVLTIKSTKKKKLKGSGEPSKIKSKMAKRKVHPMHQGSTSQVEASFEQLNLIKAREEAAAARRENPYYITDVPARQDSDDDIDSIPIVRLQDINTPTEGSRPSSAHIPGPSSSQTSTGLDLRAQGQDSSHPWESSTAQWSETNNSNGMDASQILNETGDETPSAPQVLKVTKAKKRKGGSSGKSLSAIASNNMQ